MTDLHRRLLTITEVAHELRCSKAHVSNVIAGKVKHAPRLPTVRLGRRKLVRRETLERWILANECPPERDKLRRSLEVDAARRIKGGI